MLIGMVSEIIKHKKTPTGIGKGCIVGILNS